MLAVSTVLMFAVRKQSVLHLKHKHTLGQATKMSDNLVVKECVSELTIDYDQCRPARGDGEECDEPVSCSGANEVLIADNNGIKTNAMCCDGASVQHNFACSTEPTYVNINADVRTGGPETHTCPDGTTFQCQGGTQGCSDNSSAHCADSRRALDFNADGSRIQSVGF